MSPYTGHTHRQALVAAEKCAQCRTRDGHVGTRVQAVAVLRQMAGIKGHRRGVDQWPTAVQVRDHVKRSQSKQARCDEQSRRTLRGLADRAFKRHIRRMLSGSITLSTRKTIEAHVRGGQAVAWWHG